MNAQNLESLWLRLRDRGFVEGDMPAEGEPNPWFVRAMMGVAGWIGAVFLLLFVGAGFSFILRNEGAAILTGAIVCGVASFIFTTARRNDFMMQFGLALSLAGQALIAYGMADTLEDIGATGLVMTGVQLALFFFISNGIHRIWVAGTAVFAFALFLADSGGQVLLPGLLTAGLTLVWLNEYREASSSHILRAAGYGLALISLPVILLQSGWIGFSEFTRAGQLPAWAGGILAAAAWLWMVISLFRREGTGLDSAVARGALAAAVVVALAALKAPGLAPASAIMLLGFGNGNRVLTGFGILAVLCYLSQYYYFLQITLLQKSIILMCTGAALLLVRLMMHRLQRKPGESHA